MSQFHYEKRTLSLAEEFSRLNDTIEQSRCPKSNFSDVHQPLGNPRWRMSNESVRFLR